MTLSNELHDLDGARACSDYTALVDRFGASDNSNAETWAQQYPGLADLADAIVKSFQSDPSVNSQVLLGVRVGVNLTLRALTENADSLQTEGLLPDIQL